MKNRKNGRGWVVRAEDRVVGYILESKYCSMREIKRRCHVMFGTPYSKIRVTGYRLA